MQRRCISEWDGGKNGLQGSLAYCLCICYGHRDVNGIFNDKGLLVR